MKYRDSFLKILGIILFFLGLFAIFNSIINGQPSYIFWFCYAGLIIIGLGILMRSDFLILSQLNILAVPSIFWTIDFLYYWIYGNPLFGITNYFFESPEFNLGSLVSLAHLFIVPISLICLYSFKISSKGAWKMSAIQVAILGLFSLLFTEPSLNMNCVFDACIPVPEFPWPYLFSWVLGVVAIIFVTNFLLTKIIPRQKNKNGKNDSGKNR